MMAIMLFNMILLAREVNFCPFNFALLTLPFKLCPWVVLRNGWRSEECYFVLFSSRRQAHQRGNMVPHMCGASVQ